MKISPYLTHSNRSGVVLKDDDGARVFIPLDELLIVAERLTAIHREYQNEQ